MTSFRIVVIGRNEGERLRACLGSVVAAGVPVVYVDSGSTDGSPALAATMGATVLELDPARAFSAAAGVALKAAQAKNSQAVFDSGEGLDAACENCHLEFWYPNEKAAAAAKESGAAKPSGLK